MSVSVLISSSLINFGSSIRLTLQNAGGKNVVHKLRASGRSNSHHFWANNAMLGVVASLLAVVCKRMRQLRTTRSNTQKHATGCANGRNM